MRKSPYENFSKKELILRDHLAIDRTILANERTILSYARTALGVLAAGATLIHFFPENWIKLSGMALIILGILIFIIGFVKYQKMNESISKIRKI